MNDLLSKRSGKADQYSTQLLIRSAGNNAKLIRLRVSISGPDQPAASLGTSPTGVLVLTAQAAWPRDPRDICAATGERIRKLRLAKGWRQIDLAEHAGVHEVYISDLERGAREPGLRTLSKIATALGSSLSEMLRGL